VLSLKKADPPTQGTSIRYRYQGASLKKLKQKAAMKMRIGWSLARKQQAKTGTQEIEVQANCR
jgi:hypothetical protein